MTRLQQIWRNVAIAFETELLERSSEQKDITGCGLCYALARTMTDEEESEYDPYVRLVSLYRGRKQGSWMPFKERKSDLARATFAWLMVAMTDTERSAIKEGL